MMQKYKITKDADMLAPDWLADRINYKTVKFLYIIRDGAEVLKAIVEKYFPMEDWERAYNLNTAIIKRISEYARLSFKEVIQLPYSYFLLLNRESWIDSYNSSVEGRKILKELWTLQQTGADLEAVHAFQKRKEGA